MVAWAAYFDLENDQFKKEQEQAQRSSALKGKRGRMR